MGIALGASLGSAAALAGVGALVRRLRKIRRKKRELYEQEEKRFSPSNVVQVNSWGEIEDPDFFDKQFKNYIEMRKKEREKRAEEERKAEAALKAKLEKEAEEKRKAEGALKAKIEKNVNIAYIILNYSYDQIGSLPGVKSEEKLLRNIAKKNFNKLILKKNLTVSGLRAAKEELLKVVRKAKNSGNLGKILIYYSGHGIDMYGGYPAMLGVDSQYVEKKLIYHVHKHHQNLTDLTKVHRHHHNFIHTKGDTRYHEHSHANEPFILRRQRPLKGQRRGKTKFKSHKGHYHIFDAYVPHAHAVTFSEFIDGIPVNAKNITIVDNACRYDRNSMSNDGMPVLGMYNEEADYNKVFPLSCPVICGSRRGGTAPDDPFFAEAFLESYSLSKSPEQIFKDSLEWGEKKLGKCKDREEFFPITLYDQKNPQKINWEYQNLE